MKNKFQIAMTLAVIMAMAVTALAFADTITPDADIVTIGDQPSQNLGTVTPGAILTPKISFKLVCSGKNHVDLGQTVNLNFNLAGSTVPAGSLSATNASVGAVPTSWPDDTSGGGSTNCSAAPEVLGDNGDSTVTITAPVAGGTYTYVVRYNFGFSPSEGSGDANDITGSNTTVTYTLTVAAVKTTPTINWSNPADIVYGTALGAAQLNAVASVPGTYVYTPAAGTVLNAGMGQTLHVDFTPTDTNNYNNASKDVTINVSKANATVVVNGYTGVYDASAHGASGTATGVGGADLSAGLNLGATFTNVPGGTANWTFSGGTNYNDQSGTAAIVINKADATVVVNGYTGVYDASAHGASGTATGVGGADLSAGLNLGATFTNVPGGTANWTFSGGTNYNDQSGTAAIVINKADATVVVNGYTGVYDASAHGASGTATGVGGADLSAGLNLGATFTNVPGGTANWTFSGGTNYNDQSGTAAIVINKADATVVVNGYTGVYDASAHGASGTATGVGGADLSAGLNLGATFTNVPGGTANWTFSGGTNYNDQSGTAAIVINKADATVVVNGYTGVYDASAHGASGTATGVGGADLSAGLNLGATFTNVPGGTANWTFSGGTNYNDQSGTAAIVINKADATVVVNGYTGVYDASAHGASGTATGVGGADLSAGLNLGATFTNVPGGTANWTFSGGTNYNDQSGTAAIVINKADATVVVNGYTGVYDASAHGASGTATGVGGADLSAGLNLGATFTNVPGGTANWTFSGGTNYNDQSGTAAIVINKADATVVVNGYTGVYDASAHGASGTATGVGGADLSAGLNLGATFTNVPGGTANWTFSGGTNYNDQSGTAAIVINKADATVVVNGYTGVYDASAHGASGTATGVGGADLSAGLNLGATFTNVPGGTANWTFSGGTNYNDQSGTAAIVINKANATCLISGYTGNYDGNYHGASGSCAGIGGESAGTLNLGTTYKDFPGGTAHWVFTGNGNYNNQSGDVAIVLQSWWTLKGFYQPVDMPNLSVVWNTVKNGSTVPLKFEIFAGATELMDTVNVKSFEAFQVSCTSGSEDLIETLSATGATVLRYDSTSGQFIFNWQTPKKVGTCHKVVMTTLDGSTLTAYFKLK